MPRPSIHEPCVKSAPTFSRHVLGKFVPRAWIILWLVVLSLDIWALAALPQLRFDDGLATAFSSESSRYADYRRYREAFTRSEDDVAVLFQSADFADPEDLGRVADFVIEARLVDGVDDVISVFSLRGPSHEDGGSRRLLPADLPSRGDLAVIIDDLNANTPDGARIMSADRRFTLVVVALDAGGGDPDSALATVRALSASAVEGRDLTATVTGAPAIRAETVAGLFRDVVLLNGIGMIVGSIVCAVAMRSVGLALIAGITAGTAMLWVLGVLASLGFSINVVTVAVPLLVIVLVLSDGLHLLFDLRGLRAADKPIAEAALQAVARVGPACALASTTTAMAFASLLLSESMLIRELGTAGAIATMVSLIAGLTVLPLLTVTLARLAPSFATRTLRPTPLPAIFDWRFLSMLSLRFPRIVVSCALALLAASLSLYATVEPAYSLKENLRDSSPAAMALERIDASLAPIDTVDIPVTLDLSVGGPGLLRPVGEVHDIAANLAGVALVVSAATLVPPHDGEDEAGRATRLSDVLEQMPESARKRFLSADGAEALVRIHMPDGGSARTRDFVGRLETALDGTSARRPTGFLVMSSFVSTQMISDLSRSFLAAVAMSGVVVALWFRSLRYGIVALLPNILPIALMGAWLAISGWGLQFVSGIALTVAFGIAVNDTVHVLNRLRLNAKTGAPFDPFIIARSTDEVAPVLVVTTAVLSLGLVGTFFSSTAMTGYFGGLAIAVFLLAILADLVVLPACLRLLHRGPAAFAEDRFA